MTFSTCSREKELGQTIFIPLGSEMYLASTEGLEMGVFKRGEQGMGGRGVGMEEEASRELQSS